MKKLFDLAAKFEKMATTDEEVPGYPYTVTQEDVEEEMRVAELSPKSEEATHKEESETIIVSLDLLKGVAEILNSHSARKGYISGIIQDAQEGKGYTWSPGMGHDVGIEFDNVLNDLNDVLGIK